MKQDIEDILTNEDKATAIANRAAIQDALTQLNDTDVLRLSSFFPYLLEALQTRGTGKLSQDGVHAVIVVAQPPDEGKGDPNDPTQFMLAATYMGGASAYQAALLCGFAAQRLKEQATEIAERVLQ